MKPEQKLNFRENFFQNFDQNFDQKITIFSNFEKSGIFSGFYGTNTEILPLFLDSDPEKSQIFPSDILGVQLEWKSPK